MEDFEKQNRKQELSSLGVSSEGIRQELITRLQNQRPNLFECLEALP